MRSSEMNSPVSDAQTSQPRQKPTRTESVSGFDDFGTSRDRFEDLPEGILLHILSFLPTKFAVRASLLSKRWKSLWMAVPNLIFEELPDDETGRARFHSFVERVLLLRTSPKVNEFSLRCHFDVHPHHISRWIDYAVSHCVQDVKLDLLFDGYDYDYIVPSSLLTCKSLAKFEVDGVCDLKFPCLIRLPCLKILTLTYVTFEDDHSTNMLFSNCPLLEKLILDGCTWSLVQSVHISCPCLAHLTIMEAPEEVRCKCQIVIHGTSLKSFNYIGQCEAEYCFLDSYSLVEAYIDVCPVSVCEIKNEKQQEMADRAHKLVQGLYNVNYLTISNATLQILNNKEDSFSQMPLFQNLTHLRLVDDPVDIWMFGGLMNFLRVSPSLDHLESLEGVFLGIPSPNRREDLGLPSIPECLLTKLKTITISKFYGRMEECYAIKVWLFIAGALERLCLTLLGGEEDGMELFRQLGELPAKFGSRLCIHEP